MRPKKNPAAAPFKCKWSANLVAGLTMPTILQLGSVWAAPPAGASHRSGEQLYTEYCAKCHSNAHAVRVPQLSVFRAMGPGLVLSAPEFGPLRFPGLSRTPHQPHAIVHFMTSTDIA